MHHYLMILSHHILREESPYEEVSANVSNDDDPSMLYFTFR